MPKGVAKVNTRSAYTNKYFRQKATILYTLRAITRIARSLQGVEILDDAVVTELARPQTIDVAPS